MQNLYLNLNIIQVHAITAEDYLGNTKQHEITHEYVWFILLYCIKVWTLQMFVINKIKEFETWILRRLIKYPLTGQNT